MREVANERGRVALDEAEIGESDGQAGVRIDRVRVLPSHPAPILRSRNPFDLAGAKHVDKEVEAAGRRASDFVQGRESQIAGAIAGLLEKLAAGGILDPLVGLHVPSGQEPRAGEWSAVLFDNEDPAVAVDAGDDRTDSRALRHAVYGSRVRVGVGVGNPKKRVGVGVGTALVGSGVGGGVGDGVAHGSGLTRFQV